MNRQETIGKFWLLRPQNQNLQMSPDVKNLKNLFLDKGRRQTNTERELGGVVGNTEATDCRAELGSAYTENRKAGTVINRPSLLPGEPGCHSQTALPSCRCMILCSCELCVVVLNRLCRVECRPPERLNSMGSRQAAKYPKLILKLEQ